LRLRTPVTGLQRLEGGGFGVETPSGRFKARYLVNAAGLRSDEIDRMLGHGTFTVTPRRGELIVFDKLARPLLNRILLAVPTGTTKGVLVSPTVYGNVLVGPTAENIDDKSDTSSTSAGLAFLRSEAERLLPELLGYEVTAVYVGLRAATEHDDYQLTIHVPEGYACVGGIRSTGLSASLAIAEYVRMELGAAGLPLEPKRELPEVRMPNIGEELPRPYAEEGRIAADPDYGRIVCFCERVTGGEIRDALGGPLPAVDLDGLRRRTRVLMGRCQGFYCGAEVRARLAARA
jgi:glycerol-3-phosphate dehydrogenase